MEVWSMKPRFDKKGRHVECLNWVRDSDRTQEDDRLNIFFHRDRFQKKIENLFLSRHRRRQRTV